MFSTDQSRRLYEEREWDHDQLTRIMSGWFGFWLEEIQLLFSRAFLLQLRAFEFAQLFFQSSHTLNHILPAPMRSQKVGSFPP